VRPCWCSGPGRWRRPRSFAGFTGFPPYNQHLLHDLGAFQIGIGVTVLLALRLGDALTVALAGLVAAAACTPSSHLLDLRLGGHGTGPWALGALAVLGAAALAARWQRLRQTHEQDEAAP
jgi:predicted membrane-bound spermidine synthase